MNYEYEKRQSDPHQDRSPLDQEALRLVKSWHRHPALHDLLWYKGVNLGEVDEFDLLPEIIAWMAEHTPDESPSE